jgi:hypothetical protein
MPLDDSFSSKRAQSLIIRPIDQRDDQVRNRFALFWLGPNRFAQEPQPLGRLGTTFAHRLVYGGLDIGCAFRGELRAAAFLCPKSQSFAQRRDSPSTLNI